jgi:hypothetical protein
MRTCRPALVILALALAIPSVAAVPSPSPDREARDKLEALKKRLPDIVGEWMKKEGGASWLRNNWTCVPEVRVLRRVAPKGAKAVIRFAASDENGVRDWRGDVLLTIFLTYQDGCWTTERFEAVGYTDPGTFRTIFAFLMLAIDEAAEK